MNNSIIAYFAGVVICFCVLLFIAKHRPFLFERIGRPDGADLIFGSFFWFILIPFLIMGLLISIVDDSLKKWRSPE